MYRRIQEIQASDYIGDNLIDINENFLSLDKRIDSVIVNKEFLYSDYTNIDYIFNEFQDFFNIQYFLTKFDARLSTHPLLHTLNETVDLQYQKNVNKIYLHRFNGDSVGLYDGQQWTRVIIPFVTEIRLKDYSLDDNTTYDIFMSYKNKNIVFIFQKWSTVSRQLAYIDGVYVDGTSDKNRYIGSIHILNNKTTEFSFVNDSNNGEPVRLLLWNMYNKQNCLVRCTERQQYKLKRFLSHKTSILPILKDKPYFWNKTNESNTSSKTSNNIIFLNGLTTLVKMQYSTVVDPKGENAYIGIGLNEENDPDLHNDTNSTLSHTKANNTISMDAYFSKNVEYGLNKLTTFDAGDSNVLFNINGNSTTVAHIHN
jgi:hypothetical protein